MTSHDHALAIVLTVFPGARIVADAKTQERGKVMDSKRPWLPSREEMEASRQEWLRRNPAERHVEEVEQWRNLLSDACDKLRRTLTCLNEVLERGDFNTADFEEEPWCTLIDEAENLVLGNALIDAANEIARQ